MHFPVTREALWTLFDLLQALVAAGHGQTAGQDSCPFNEPFACEAAQ